MSRRERVRDVTREEIKALARQQMVEQGTAALSLGAIARAMEITPSGLYRYFASRDALITALIVDAYHALADALEQSVAPLAPADYAGRLLASGLAYRGWALAHPVDFLLIFGTPIPGYDAPLDTTVLPARRVFRVFLLNLQEAYLAGALRLTRPAAQLAAVIGVGMPYGPDAAMQEVAPEVAYIGQASWAKLHGMVMLELTHHMLFEDPDAFVRYELHDLLAGLGLPSADSS